MFVAGRPLAYGTAFRQFSPGLRSDGHLDSCPMEQIRCRASDRWPAGGTHRGSHPEGEGRRGPCVRRCRRRAASPRGARELPGMPVRAARARWRIVRTGWLQGCKEFAGSMVSGSRASAAAIGIYGKNFHRTWFRRRFGTTCSLARELQVRIRRPFRTPLQNGRRQTGL